MFKHYGYVQCQKPVLTNLRFLRKYVIKCRTYVTSVVCVNIRRQSCPIFRQSKTCRKYGEGKKVPFWGNQWYKGYV